MNFVICPKQGPIIDGIVLNRVAILGLFFPEQVQGLRPSVAPLHPNVSEVPPPRSSALKSRLTYNSGIENENGSSDFLFKFTGCHYVSPGSL